MPASVSRRTKVQTNPRTSRSKAGKGQDTREPLNMRVRPDVRALIDHAADLTGKNRTDFILDAAHSAAQNAVLDQTILRMSPKAYDAFLKLLDAAPRPNARLRKTLLTKPEWE